MIKLKNILLKEEMSSSDKRDMKSSSRNIGFHVGYIDKEAAKMIKLLNKQGLRKSAEEINKSFKRRSCKYGGELSSLFIF